MYYLNFLTVTKEEIEYVISSLEQTIVGTNELIFSQMKMGNTKSALELMESLVVEERKLELYKLTLTITDAKKLETTLKDFTSLLLRRTTGNNSKQTFDRNKEKGEANFLREVYL